jgi:transcriptional regulator with PAS, ATPase and Fis domain
MTETKASAGVLVVARRHATRRRISAAITPELAVWELDPSTLPEPAALLDAAGMVVVLEARDGLELIDDLEPLRALPAQRSLVLALETRPDDEIEAALAALAPSRVVTHPGPDAVLRHAVRVAFAAADPGRGARPDQRRAPALLGVSSAIRKVLEQVRQVAPARIPALILGETGTGKELVARALHAESPRAARPFVAVNCGALPDTLLESELFGHRRGAFTGAEQDKRGLFEEADGGTLFLDEIGDMSPALQVKLLRVLETQEVRALGGTGTTRIDVRLVSATNRDLEAAIEEGSFRQDLYYRINTVTIYVPPLRRRRVDIPFLAQHFAEEFGSEHARRITLDEEFLETLSRFDFPGNVRELRNAVERSIALAAADEPVSPRHLVTHTGESLPLPVARGGTLRERVLHVEREAIAEALQTAGGNRTRAAEALGLSRQGLRYKMRRLHMIGADEG